MKKFRKNQNLNWKFQNSKKSGLIRENDDIILIIIKLLFESFLVFIENEKTFIKFEKNNKKLNN